MVRMFCNLCILKFDGNGGSGIRSYRAPGFSPNVWVELQASRCWCARSAIRALKNARETVILGFDLIASRALFIQNWGRITKICAHVLQVVHYLGNILEPGNTARFFSHS